MIKSMVVALAIATMVSTACIAKTLPLPPKGKPVATVAIPDDWTQSDDAEDGEYALNSKDQSLIVVIGSDEKLQSEAETTAEAAKELGKDFEIVAGSVKSSNDQVNGMKAVVTRLQLRKVGEGRALPITITQIVTPKPDFVVHVILTNLTEGTEHEAEIDSVLHSLKLAD